MRKSFVSAVFVALALFCLPFGAKGVYMGMITDINGICRDSGKVYINIKAGDVGASYIY